MKNGILKIALAGNPNVGKSTLFNALTGLHQHTGNWPGKTVGTAVGTVRHQNTELELTDLPGTYSLNGYSPEEQIAAQAIKSGKYDCIVAVCDGSALERSLILALQILNQAVNVVICINLMDEAEKNGIAIDQAGLEHAIGVPIICTSAGKKQGLDSLLSAVTDTTETLPSACRRWDNPIEDAQNLAAQFTTESLKKHRKYDKLLVSRGFGIALMMLFLLLIIWLTVWGANYPSELMSVLFDKGYLLLDKIFGKLPWAAHGILVDGVYGTTARVISVMLPPMLIFFPLFTFMEDIGYLPRMAFLMDHGMSKCGCCGKCALTLCMGLGCNAVGITGCRIVDSPRERLLAILTNAMIPCNGRFPTLIIFGSVFFPRASAALMVAGAVVLGIWGVMGCSRLLCKLFFRDERSSFIMEMPPFRRPNMKKILITSVYDRTISIALRAIKVAAPAGAVLWTLSNTRLFSQVVLILNPLGEFLGMNGILLLAFVLSLPANELFLPVVFMGLTGNGTFRGVTGYGNSLLLSAGWDWTTAVCTMVFTVFHWPCATTILTIFKETGSVKKTAAAVLLPTAVGMLLCMILNLIL